MVSEDKLIKQGIKLTDAWFEKFKKQIEHDLNLCETYEEFIERTKEYTTANILINSGYSAEMQSLITQILNNHRFQRASQRALIEETINNNVGHLIQDVGEEIKETVRDVVKEGYDEGSHPREIARNINGRIDSINHRRARTIARTEVKRTDTVANYVRHKEQGATGFNVQCRPDCCPLCAKDYAHKDPKKQQARLNRIAQMKRDKVDDPLVRGKGETIGGNVEFSMDDTLMLPPRHPNCRCTAMFVYGTVETEEPKTTTTTTTTTEPQTKEPSIKEQLTPKELKRYEKAQKNLEKANKMLDKLASDDPRRIMYESRIEDAERTIKRLEKMAADPTQREVVEETVIKQGGKKNTDLDYNKITSNEDIADYFGLTYIEESTTQYGKTTSRPIFRDEEYNTLITGMERMDISEVKEFLRSYDTSNPILKSAPSRIFLDPDSKIKELGVYNPGSNTITFYSHQRDLDSNSIKSTVDHELTHAFDCLLNPEYTKFSSQKDKEYRKIVREEGWSSLYSYSTKGATRISEDMAECGSMVLNKNDPNVKIKMSDGEIITAREWCERFPKKTAYFEELLKSKEAQSILQNR